MKKVILKQVKNFILLEDLNDTHIIGVRHKDGLRGVVVKVNGKYIIHSLEDLNFEGNYITKDTIQDLLSIDNVEAALVFDSPLELGEWLIKDLK